MSRRNLAGPMKLSCTPAVVWNGLTLNLKIENEHMYAQAYIETFHWARTSKPITWRPF